MFSVFEFCYRFLFSNVEPLRVRPDGDSEPSWCIFGTSLKHLAGIFGSLGALLGPCLWGSLGCLGPPWVNLWGAFCRWRGPWVVFEGPWGVLGTSLRCFGRSLACLGDVYESVLEPRFYRTRGCSNLCIYMHIAKSIRSQVDPSFVVPNKGCQLFSDRRVRAMIASVSVVPVAFEQ